jgi:hypothetical protein
MVRHGWSLVPGLERIQKVGALLELALEARQRPEAESKSWRGRDWWKH